ncbi:MFS transporter, partial [Staphylococcus arlettae]
LYTLIKSLGSSIGATLMGVIYAMEISYVQLHIHNIIYATFIFLTVLVILWVSLNQRIKK